MHCTPHIIAAALILVLSCFGSAASAQDQAEAGEALYDEHCASCHGEKLRSAGVMPDLRQLGPGDRPRFDQAVLDGRGQMSAWRGVLSEQQLDQLWTYVRSRTAR